MTQGQPLTSRGQKEPSSVQFSLFLANRVGQLREMLSLFAEESLAVIGVSVVDSTDWAVIRLVFSDANKARETFKAHGLPFTESEVLLAELDGAEALSEICKALVRAEINVHSAYPLIVHQDNNPVMVFHVDEPVLAAHVLTTRGVRLLGSEDLADPR